MSTNNSTPGNANNSYRDLVDADKKSIFEKLLNSTLPKSKSTNNTSSATSNGKNGSTAWTQSTDYDAIFGEDVDDSEQLFQDILRRAKEEFEKQKELKKKYPNDQVLHDIFKKPAPKNTRKTTRKNTRKTKTKAVEKTLAIMNDFKNRLLGPVEPALTLPTVTSSNNDYNRFKSSIKTFTQGNESQKRVYPTWKTTETYTPVFSVITNPNWANLRLNSAKTNLADKMRAPVQHKLYTPGHIDSWMDAATSFSTLTEPPTCKSIRSDVAVHNSDSDEDSLKSLDDSSIYFSPKFKSIANQNSNVNYKTPPKITTSSTTPMKSTTVHFKPSPPEYFVYGNNSNSSISSKPIFVEENENSSLIGFPQNHNQSYQGHSGNSSLQNSPVSLQYSPWKENIEYEEHHRFFSSGDLHSKINKKESNDSMKKPAMFVEDFVRKLNYNISNNYNMELKCSMKVKYYK